MGTTLTSGGFRFAMTGTESTTIGATSRSVSFPAGYSKTMTSGTATSAANCIASILGTVTAGTPGTINLFSLTSASTDDPLVLASVKGILIQDKTGTVTTANKLQVGDSTGTLTSAFTGFWGAASGVSVINSGGALAIAGPDDGYAVDTSHKYLVVKAAAGTIVYQIDIMGTK